MLIWPIGQGGNELEAIKEKQVEEIAYKVASFNGIDIFWIKTEKFKTNSINIYFLDNLTRENVTKNALLPAVLRRGSSGHPTFRDIAMRLEELYGSSFDCDVSKKGEIQIIQFYTEFLSDKYAGTGSRQFENASDLLFEIMSQPLLKDGCFLKEYVDLEKDNLKKLIGNRVNDKMQYSLERCFDEMCRNEPYGIYEYGIVEDLERITPQELLSHFRQVLATYPAKVYITGDMDEDRIMKVVARLSTMERGEIKTILKNKVERDVASVSEITEKLNISQGKLSLGFRTNISADSQDYYTLMVYNGILGGGMHSKLFQNVREKASLAYYAYSRMEKYKGLMVVSSGIEIANKEKAKEIVLQQLEDIRNGKISDQEFDSTIKTIETGLKSLRDGQMQIVDFNLGQEVAGTDDSFETLIEKVKKVGRDDIVAIAPKIVLDTVYFLTSVEGV